MKNELKNTVIIYHADCRDGFGAAYAAWKKFGEDASYIPLNASVNIPPEGLTNKDVFIVDFSFTKDVLQALVDSNKSVLVIDHHISAKEDVLSFEGNIFDNDHSGAVLTWKYFHPETEVPSLLEYVEDHDLWRFALPENREFNVALGRHDMTFESWDALIEELKDNNNLINFIAKGAMLAKFEDKLVAHMMTRKERVLFEGHEIWVLNTSEYASVLGNQLAELNFAEEQTPIGIVYYHSDGKVKMSLRSLGETDVSIIAQKYGGGGHKNASGMAVTSFDELPFTFI
ncbi:MAG: oligoribonuclease NrnB/cAMP/cGMP phosphodiesterase (DHH superfamily) [Patiriisocius sp.]|jgi:oligoribonuclease NrnB/cAMP/cGMP phosphodiesterase (DHH superfamily)